MSATGEKRGPAPIVTGISPKEATAGTKITIRGENLGVNDSDILGVLILGADCFMTVEWKSQTKITALCPAEVEGKGEIIIATVSGGLGTCTVGFRAYRESVMPLKEVAFWVEEKRTFRRRRRLQDTSDFLCTDDALGLSVEGNTFHKFPEETLLELFPGSTPSGDVAQENFHPLYFLLETHHSTNFEDLKAGMSFLRRKLDTLGSIRRCYMLDAKEGEPTKRATEAITAAKQEADRMFFDVLGRKDRADATRNTLNVMNRFKFLFLLPANIEANIAKGDYDRVIDEYDRAMNLYGDSDIEIFRRYLDEVERAVEELKLHLKDCLEKDASLSIETQKKYIANLVQLNFEGDPGWNLLQINYSRLLKTLNQCKEEHLEHHSATPANPHPLLTPNLVSTHSSNKYSNLQFLTDADSVSPPKNVIFVEDIAERLTNEFPDLWKLGQSYFKGDLVVSPDATKSPVFKEMILGCIRYVSNLIRAAVIPQTLNKKKTTENGEEDDEYGEWNGLDYDKSAQWLPFCLRYARSCYAVFIELDLPSQALDILKRLTTDLRIQCLQTVFHTVIVQVHLLHEKEDWKLEMSDQHGCITELPEMFATVVNDSVQLIKEAIVIADEKEENILSIKNAQGDLEHLIQNVLSSFAFTLENTAIQEYRSESSYEVPKDSMRLLLCINNCHYTLTQVLPKIQKAFQDVGNLSLETPIHEATKCYTILHGKLFEAYMELKCEPIVSTIEPTMYVGKFDWARCPKPTDARDYVKEIIHNVISVHSEVERISCKNSHVKEVMLRLVEAVTEEVNRLFCSIHRMNSNGCIQAWVDINCLSFALKPFLNKDSAKYLDEASKPLLELERPGDRQIVKSCQNQFEKRMKFHLYAFQINEIQY
ncbi:EXOC2 [Lepeophtheirus salmonis]|uniref:Exocyst complex component 2 n=1 Tax=Lepeophtheirus salmonis TaxID=72036 RepID=A0A7R8CZ98_LEPSM|nr:EXOC2 [Lepeophtheirus salmonis]CAF2948280.1 EXOC2 [Lepeophtheirus salmonis]